MVSSRQLRVALSDDDLPLIRQALNGLAARTTALAVCNTYKRIQAAAMTVELPRPRTSIC